MYVFFKSFNIFVSIKFTDLSFNFFSYQTHSLMHKLLLWWRFMVSFRVTCWWYLFPNAVHIAALSITLPLCQNVWPDCWQSTQTLATIATLACSSVPHYNTPGSWWSAAGESWWLHDPSPNPCFWPTSRRYNQPQAGLVMSPQPRH